MMARKREAEVFEQVVRTEMAQDTPGQTPILGDDKAEQAVLGATWLEADCPALVLSRCRKEDFHRIVHQELFECMKAVYERHEPVDLITMGRELKERGWFDKCGGPEYLIACQLTPPTSRHLPSYIDIVVRLSIQRQMAALGTELQDGAYTGENGKMSEIARRLLELEADKQVGRGQTMAELCNQNWEWQVNIVEQPRQVDGPRFGIPTIDNNLGGLMDWELVIIKAEEKFGKTRLLRQSALATAEAGIPVLVYILEGNPRRWWQGCVSWLGNLDGRMLDRGGRHYQTNDQNKAMMDAIAGLSNLPIRVSTRHRTVRAIEADALAQWETVRPRPGAVYVDYLQLISHPGARGRVEEIKAALDMMLFVNSRTGMPIITASQINKEHQSFYSSEAEFAAGLVLEIERGPAGAGMPAHLARWDDKMRLICTHKRYGPMLKTRELRADWATGRFYDV